MNRQKGLLAFFCAAIAAACALLQIPVVSGMEQLFDNASLPLAIHLSSAETPQLPHGPGGVEPVTVQSLRKDLRPDSEIENLVRTYRLPFWPLKAYLAITSKGVRGTGGLFWSRLPEGDAQLPDDGLSRTRAGAAFLSKLQKETGSLEGALIAWEVGSYRARRALEAEGAESMDELLAALRLHLLASHRHQARTFLCTVMGLALALDARWPVEDQFVHAPMPGRILFAGNDGPRGKCLVLAHACELCTEICRLQDLEVGVGQRVQKGQKLGTAGPEAPWFGLRAGQRVLDPAVLKPKGEEDL